MRLAALPTREPLIDSERSLLPRSAPVFLATLDGLDIRPIGIQKLVRSVRVLLDHRKADMCELVLHNAEETVGADTLFREGVRVSLRVGYGGSHTDTVGEFLVTRPRQVFQGTRPTITLQGLGLEVQLGQRERRRMWFDHSDSAIAEAVAKEYGLASDVEPTGRIYSRVSQINLTDWEFLKKRAKLYNYTLFVRDGVLHYHPARLEDSGVVLHYRNAERGVIRRAEVLVSTFRRAPRVVRTTYDPLTGALVRQESEPERDAITVVEDREEVGRIRTADELSRRPVRFQVGGGHKQDVDEISRQVNALGQANAYVVQLSLAMVGDARLRPGQTVRVEGIGNHAGRYYLKSVTHAVRTATGGPATFTSEVVALRQFLRDEREGVAQSLVETSSTGTRIPLVGSPQDITSTLRIRSDGR